MTYKEVCISFTEAKENYANKKINEVEFNFSKQSFQDAIAIIESNRNLKYNGS